MLLVCVALPMRRHISSLCALALAFPCVALLMDSAPASGAVAQETASSSVINGKPASISGFPWLAFVSYRGPVDKFDCSGTVVAPRLVLTAGHCILGNTGRLLTAANFRVMTGQSDYRLAEPENISAVSQVLMFPGYQPSRNSNDAALLVLAAPVSAPAIPLAGPGEAALYNAGTALTVAGWGQTRSKGPGSPTLRYGSTAIQGTGFCRRVTRPVTPFYNAASQFCAADSNEAEGSCHGDSGGPGIAMRADGIPVQVGIISLGPPTCDLASPEIQTRVDQVSAWVASWASSLANGTPAPAIASPPRMRLPFLSFRLAGYFGYVALARTFGNRWVRGKYKKDQCWRIDREKVKCKVFWFYNQKVYDGSITVFLSLPREGAIWNYGFRIKRYNAYCWVYSPSLRRCRRTLFYR